MKTTIAYLKRLIRETVLREMGERAASVKVYPVTTEAESAKYARGTKWALPTLFSHYTKFGSRFVFVVKRDVSGPAQRFMCVITSDGKEHWFNERDRPVDPHEAFGELYAQVKEQM